MSAEVEFHGLAPEDANDAGTIAAALMMLKYSAANMNNVLDDIGKQGVKLTTEKLVKNKVTPKTTEGVLARRRKYGKGKYKGITLVDTGIGLRQVSYRVLFNKAVEVGVPDGYMAYHEQGRVPHAPQRRFLTMPKGDYIYRAIRWHWSKALRKARAS
jgi:hypothetical protein